MQGGWTWFYWLMTVYDLARRLPGIGELRARCRALAMLDAVLSPEWEARYYSFNSLWASGEEMGSMRNGSGDDYFIVFSNGGVFMRGFDHESPMSPYRSNPPRLWPGIVDDLPAVFAPYVGEPAFSMPGSGVLLATFCLWRQESDDRWRTGSVQLPGGDDPDGADWMCALLTERSAVGYQRFAEDYYEVEVEPAAIEHVYGLLPLTPELVRGLNPDLTLSDLAEDIAEIGYPAVA